MLSNIKCLDEKLKVIENTITPTTFMISKKDMDFVNSTLAINKLYAAEDLTKLRNAIVLHYQKVIESYDKGAYDDWQKYVTLTSAITHCIDMRLADLGLMY